MFPLAHLAFGYLAAAAVQRIRNQPPPRRWILVAVLFGTQIPDLVDKPLVYVGVLSSGRSLGHSLLVALPLLVVVLRVGHRLGYGEHAIAFTVGVLSHYVGDTYRSLLAGNFDSVRFLLWPVFPPLDYPVDSTPPWIRAINSVTNPQHRIQFVLVGIAVAIWAFDLYRRRQQARHQQ
ncbi:metal-dependent hydrolase [Haloferax sp. YSMS24]|uniref:metal-dependent hydrolase n=1 Tax=Haloferax sp. YSMS24 TaxID=3388425 RepID=UPI00398CEA97